MMPPDEGEPRQLRPPHLGLMLAEVRGILEFNASLLLSPLLMRAPRGDGHPVLALPGFLASDLSMAPLRRYLSELGYDTHGWQMGRNTGGVSRMRAALRDRLEEHSQRPNLRYTQAIVNSGREAGASLDLNFGARRVYLVLGSPGYDRQVKVLLDGQPISSADAGSDVHSGAVTVSGQRLYNLVDLPAVGHHVLSLEPEAGVEGYAFTFG